MGNQTVVALHGDSDSDRMREGSRGGAPNSLRDSKENFLEELMLEDRL